LRILSSGVIPSAHRLAGELPALSYWILSPLELLILLGVGERTSTLPTIAHPRPLVGKPLIKLLHLLMCYCLEMLSIVSLGIPIVTGFLGGIERPNGANAPLMLLLLSIRTFGMYSLNLNRLSDLARAGYGDGLLQVRGLSSRILLTASVISHGKLVLAVSRVFIEG